MSGQVRFRHQPLGFPSILQFPQAGWRLEWPDAGGDAEPHLWGFLPQIGECGIGWLLLAALPPVGPAEGPPAHALQAVLALAELEDGFLVRLGAPFQRLFRSWH